MAQAGIIFAVRAIQIEYIKPALFNQLLQVSAEAKNLKRASLEFAQKITHDDRLLVTADVRIACLDVESMKPKAIPDYLLRHFTHEY